MNNEGAELILSGLYIYPIKSLKGIPLVEAIVEGRGLMYDRRWMLVDAGKKFITQREYSKLARVTPSLAPAGLEIRAEGREPLHVPYENTNTNKIEVQVWNDTCTASLVSDEANHWFSTLLDAECQLVHMPVESERLVDRAFAINNDTVSFADAYPFLLATEGSLRDLNTRSGNPVPMNRFRPNFVVSGSGAFAEDNWKLIKIGDSAFHVVKPSARCVMTTVDQESGERPDDEPLRTLSSYRKRDNKVLFGQNLIASGDGGTVSLGDRITVVETVS